MSEQATKQAQQPQQPTPAMGEAGFSMTAKMLDKHGTEVLLTFRAPMANQAEKCISHYEVVVEQLIGAGWQPLKAASRPAGNGGGQAAATGDAPTCQFHGPMKRSNHGNGFYCPKKMGDGSYCKEKG